VAKFGVVTFNRISICLTIRNSILPWVIHQASIRWKSITEVLVGSWPLIYNFLHIVCVALPHHITPNEATSTSIYFGDDVDLLFLSPMKVKSSSNSATSTSFGTGAAGISLAYAFTHSDTVRWCNPRWRPIRRRFIPSTYNWIAFFRSSRSYPLALGSGVYLQPQYMHLYRWLLATV
jgi:hypothetical protein